MLSASVSSLGLVVLDEDFPSLLAHEAWWWGLSVLGHLSHSGSRDELEVFLDTAWASEELHSLRFFIISSDLEWADLDTVEESLVVDEELLSVPHIVAVLASLDWVLDSGWVTSSDEVGDSSVDSGGGVPQDLGWASVVHWGWPDGEDDVLAWEGSILDEGGVLSHSVVEWDIIVLAPSTEWVKEEDWVLVSELDELLSGVLKEEDVSIVEWVSNLEGVDGVGSLLLSGLLDLLGGESVAVKAIVVGNLLDESHGLS